jgi:hypothetical protein
MSACCGRICLCFGCHHVLNGFLIIGSTVLVPQLTHAHTLTHTHTSQDGAIKYPVPHPVIQLPKGSQ